MGPLSSALATAKQVAIGLAKAAINTWNKVAPGTQEGPLPNGVVPYDERAPLTPSNGAQVGGMIAGSILIAAGAAEADPALAEGDTAVIGKIADLRSLRSGEHVLDLPNLGNPRANWAQNSSVLRREMSLGQPIRDATVDPHTGALINNTGFLRAERNLLQNHDWIYNPTTTTWQPPTN